MKTFQGWQFYHSSRQAGPPSWRDATAPLIILPVRDVVLFPGSVLSLTVGRSKSIAAAQQAVREQRPIGILMQRDARVPDPGPIDLHRIGTVANIVRCTIAPDGSYHLVCQGELRFRVTDFVSAWPFFEA
ncbi:MAG TPA: LON peptidase substrate-binding domain-containing protein, partial [Hyphomicrobiaceae bacterium]|nr:LON peptidase substrate-binding domain-containing protein [Hyphomicrobiaceae bacterium]